MAEKMQVSTKSPRLLLMDKLEYWTNLLATHGIYGMFVITEEEIPAYFSGQGDIVDRIRIAGVKSAHAKNHRSRTPKQGD